ncbi:MAG: hypothetical protein ACRYGR_09235 [Janthinobacterium lividum]
MSKFVKSMSLVLSVISFCPNAQTSNELNSLEDICNYTASHLRETKENISTSNVYELLNQTFKNNKISDYSQLQEDKAKSILHFKDDEDLEEFNQKLSSYFVTNTQAQYPNSNRHFDHILIGTSGINVLVERLALLAEMSHKNVLNVDKIVMLVGDHAHRQNLQNVDYLLNDMLPIFEKQFGLSADDLVNLRQYLTSKVQEKWTHQTAAEVAWKILDSSPVMHNLHHKFEFFHVPNGRTEELLQKFNEQKLDHKSQNYVVGFLCNAQGAQKTKEIAEKVLGNEVQVNFLITRPLTGDDETKLHHNTPLENALTRTFHLYRILEAKK